MVDLNKIKQIHEVYQYYGLHEKNYLPPFHLYETQECDERATTNNFRKAIIKFWNFYFFIIRILQGLTPLFIIIQTDVPQ